MQINIIAVGSNFAEKIASFTAELTGTDAEIIAQAQALVAERGFTVLTDAEGGCCELDNGQIAITVDVTEDDDNDMTLIFDNGGGLTAQLGDFAHYYNNMAQAAADVAAYISNPNTSDWEGHEPEAAELDPDYDEIRNGGYRVYSSVDAVTADAECGWANVKAFTAAWQAQVHHYDN